MDDFDSSEFRERLLQLNANPEFIVQEFAEVLRDLLRAVSSKDTSAGAFHAAERMSRITDLVARCEKKPSWRFIVAGAVGEICDRLPEDGYDAQFVEAAQRGIKFLVESTASDNAAKGRASRRLQEFENAIRRASEPRGRL